MALAVFDEQPVLTLRQQGINLHLYTSHYLINTVAIKNKDYIRDEWQLLEDPRVPLNAKKWFMAMGLDISEPPSHVIVATKDHNLVGFFRFLVNQEETELEAAGTWVVWEQRRKGIGYAMWAMAMRRFPKVRFIAVTAGTQSGERFINALSKSGFPLD